jgi:hypothetical protein
MKLLTSNEITVVASYKAGFGLELENLFLENETGKITITKSQWKEIQTVMSGKRKSAHSQEFDGYTPKTAVYWN